MNTINSFYHKEVVSITKRLKDHLFETSPELISFLIERRAYYVMELEKQHALKKGEYEKFASTDGFDFIPEMK